MTTLETNSNQNLVWFHALSFEDKQALVDEIETVHYASIYHDELVRIYKTKVKPSLLKKDLLKDAFNLDDDLTTLVINK